MRYRIKALLTISVSTDVEADSIEEAREIAADRPIIDLCHQCSVGDADEQWVTSGELDGSPQISEDEP